MKRALVPALHAAVLLTALAACTVEPVDFSTKTCPCDQGFVCDEVRDRCVEPGDEGVLEGLVAYYPLDEDPATSASDPQWTVAHRSWGAFPGSLRTL